MDNGSHNDADKEEATRSSNAPCQLLQLYSQPGTEDKHPLEHTWTWWYLESDRSRSWSELQNEVISFNTVEDFWNTYYHLKPPTEMKHASDYSVFKKGINPMWEDNSNENGGRWIMMVNKDSVYSLDGLWLNVLLMMIGEYFDFGKEICGAVVNVRAKTHKISIWTGHAENHEAILEIGTKIKNRLKLDGVRLTYELHKDTMSKQGPAVKPLFTL